MPAFSNVRLESLAEGVDLALNAWVERAGLASEVELRTLGISEPVVDPYQRRSVFQILVELVPSRKVVSVGGYEEDSDEEDPEAGSSQAEGGSEAQAGQAGAEEGS